MDTAHIAQKEFELAEEIWSCLDRNCSKILVEVRGITIVHIQLTCTPGTVGGPGGRDRTLAVKSKKKDRK